MISARNSAKKLCLTIIFFLTIFFPKRGCSANSVSSARAVGLGAGYIAIARGIEAPLWNPANLGLKDNPEFSDGILSFGIRFGNNSFSRLDYNRFVGVLLHDADIKAILHKIPETGLKINSRSDIKLINISYKNFAFTSTTEINIAGTIAKDYLDIILNGN